MILAWALSVHKSQGQTVDQTFVLASRHMDAYSTYVALTRHRLQAKLYYAREDFADFKSLQMGLGRVQDKDLIIDYHKRKRRGMSQLSPEGPEPVADERRGAMVVR